MTLLFIIQNLKKHLWKKSDFLTVLFSAALIAGCGDKQDKKEFVARVNESYLSKDDLDEKLDTSFNNNFYRNEIIRNWIDEELLYQEAESEGILNDKDFENIINNSRKELAAALLLKKVFEQYKFTYNDNNLEEFYRENQNQFKLNEDAFILNVAEFRNEDEAIDFRTSVLQQDWQNVAQSKKYESINSQTNIMIGISEIYPAQVRNLVQELYPRELSIVIQTDSLGYKIYQVVEIFHQGTIPPFNFIKEKVEKRFVSFEKRKFINEYIKKLYAENDIEVKNQDYK